MASKIKLLIGIASIIASSGIVATAMIPVAAQTETVETAQQLSNEEILAEAERLNEQVEDLYSQGKYAEAIPIAERVLALRQQAIQGDHPDVALSLQLLAFLYNFQGRYSDAEPLFSQALAMYQRLYPGDHPNVATNLNNLAALYTSQGKYSKAEPLYSQALAMRQRLYNFDHPDVAGSFFNLAELYSNQGRYGEAESLLKQALAMYQRLYDGDNPDVARSLYSLAIVYYFQNKYSEAEPLLVEALAMTRRLYKSDHFYLASAINNLANLYLKQNRYSEAEPLLIEALDIVKRIYDGDHPYVASSLNNLASTYFYQSKYTKAENLFNQAIDMYKRLYNVDHREIAYSFNNLAALYWSKEEYSNTLVHLTQATEIEENFLKLNLSGSEAQKQAYLDTFTRTTNRAISLHLQYQLNNLDAVNLAFTTILRRKGRILDSTANSLPTLRQRLDPENQKLLDQLAETRSKLSSLVYTGIGDTQPEQYQQQIKSLEIKAEKLEAQLAAGSAEFKTQTATVTISAVQQQIPTDAALVEFIQYKPYEPKTSEYGEPRYAAYILTNSGQPQWVDLGIAATIDAAVTTLRQALQDIKANPDYIKQTARELDTLVMQPVRQLLGSQTHLLVAPDSQLNLIPFEALVDENNQYLVENYAITYLTSGRDLLRFDNNIQSQQPPFVVANPEYSASPQLIASVEEPSNSRAVDLNELAWCCVPLQGTEAEAQAISPLLPDNTTVLTQTEATEASVKEVNSPSILHIATHGFFLPDVEVEPTEPNLGLANNNQPPVAVGKNPLLRSGLAFAGFNPAAEQYEGVLTALEVASLNLWGTELVVLSACQTGVGDVRNGEGVYGLRRALVLAGSESQLISLWDVDDEGTKDLMTSYYQKLTQGVGRGEALRQTQLEMLNSEQYSHPYFWAAFIGSGDWQPVEGLGANN